MLKELVRQLIVVAVKNLHPEFASEIELTVPPDSKMGDLASNIALILAKPLKQKPFEVAQKIKDLIDDKAGLLESVSIAGPGFLNFKVKPQFWIGSLKAISDAKNLFGQSKNHVGKKALVEFVSANPTGPLHIGHGRNAVVGDTLGNLLKAIGYNVEKEYYVNDGGVQINTLGKSVYFRYLELQGQKVNFPEEAYQGEYIVDLAREQVAKKDQYAGKTEADLIPLFGRWAADIILDQIKNEMKMVGVTIENTFYESTLYKNKNVEAILKELDDKKVTYELDGAKWLKSTAYGDDKDRVLVKNDGSYTYLTPDVAYHKNKFDRGYDLMINIWGADHAGYVPRLKSALKSLGNDENKLQVVLIQMVNLIRDGQMVSMSTRKATYETLENVVKEVGKDVSRYFFMMRSWNAQLDFDLKLAKEQSADNPVFYIQYAHARICSIFAKAASSPLKLDGQWPAFDESFTQHLVLPEEIGLAQFLLSYPQIVEVAARELAPHRITFFAHELARHFQSYYDKARADTKYRVIDDQNLEKTKAKLYLLGAIRQVLQNNLTVLGITAPEKM